MPNDPNLQEAMKRIDCLKAELAKWQQYVELHNELFRDSEPRVVSVVVKSASQVERRWTSAEIVEEAMRVLAEVKRPMKLAELYDALLRRSVPIGGKNPRNNLGAMLSAEKARLATGRYGWWFKDEAPPRQLCDFDEYEEGPDTEVTRPLHSNGVGIINA